MFDRIDKNEMTRLFLISVVFIVVAYFLGRWLMSL
jgi:hypothetical protein